jgi:hypothetical protein
LAAFYLFLIGRRVASGARQLTSPPTFEPLRPPLLLLSPRIRPSIRFRLGFSSNSHHHQHHHHHHHIAAIITIAIAIAIIIITTPTTITTITFDAHFPKSQTTGLCALWN